MSSSIAADILQQVLSWIKNGLVGPHNHSTRQGGPIVSDLPITVTNPLAPAIISRTQILNQNFNADLWRGQRYYVQSTKPTSANNGDLLFDGVTLWEWNGKTWVNALSGIVPVTSGGTGTSTAFTPGSVIFAGASGVYSQDNANLYWNDSNYQLLLSGTTPLASIGTSPAIQLSASGSASIIAQVAYNNTPGSPPVFIGHRARGTLAVPAAVQSGDSLFQFSARGYDGSAFTTSKGIILFVAAENWVSGSNNGTYFSLYTTKKATTSAAEQMRILDNGIVALAQGLVSQATLTPTITVGTVGSLGVPKNAGVLTDALAGNADGCIGVDTTNNLVMVRSTNYLPAASRAMMTYGNATNTPGTTDYLTPIGSYSSTTESVVQMIAPAGVARKLRANLESNTLSSATTTLTLRKNGVNTALTVNWTFGVTGVKTDTSDSVAVAEGDLLSFGIVTSAGGTGNNFMGAISFLL